MYLQEVITFVEFCGFFLVNCKGKFLITYIFHDVSSYKSIKFHSYRFLLTVLD